MLADTANGLTRLWGRRGLWQVSLRWSVPPLIVALGIGARAVGFELPLTPLFVIALWVLGYNTLFFVLLQRHGAEVDRAVAIVGILADYAGLLALLHFTGGASSPLLVLLILHVIFAAIQFRPGLSIRIAAVAAGGLWLMALARSAGWIPLVEVGFRGEAIFAPVRPAFVISRLSVFTATLFLIAGITGVVMQRYKQRVAELVEERTQFMLQTAHNLRAPLGAGLSMLDLVQGGYAGEVAPQQQKLLDKIEARLRALHRTIGEILTIAKTRDWSREITDVIVDLDELARHTEQMFREEAEAKKIAFTVEVEPGLPDIDSGADLLDQLMENLVSNAIKYTPQGGKVWVRFTQIHPDEIRILVEDTGIGIPSSEQHRLFQEFFRASNAKRATAAGTGLGLTLVRKTVERHRGRVHLASEVGRGTTVVVDLPTRQPKSTAREALEASSASAPASSAAR